MNRLEELNQQNIQSVALEIEHNRLEKGATNNLKKHETLGAILYTLEMIVEMRDSYTACHQQRVANLACAIAKEMSFSKDRIDDIHMAGLVHDIGKLYISVEILNKCDQLNKIEFDLIKTHPQYGYELLKKMKFPEPVLQIVLQHHERIDGSGYPKGLSDEEIILEARILGVVDVVDAITLQRPYRFAMGIEKALEEISQNKRILYDPRAVEAVLKFYTEKKFKFDKVMKAETLNNSMYFVHHNVFQFINNQNIVLNSLMNCPECHCFN